MIPYLLRVALILAGCTGAAIAQQAPKISTAPVDECPAEQPAVRAGTYVALGDGLLLRLQVKGSLASATLIVNQVDGNRLYDRRYWKPSQLTDNCGVRTIDYQIEALPEEADSAGERAVADANTAPATQRLRLVLQRAQTERRPGIPRPVTFFRGSLLRPEMAPVPLQFEEVVIRREIGAG